MNLTKLSRPCSHFGIIFEQEEGKCGIPLYQTWHIVNSITLYHFTSHSIRHGIRGLDWSRPWSRLACDSRIPLGKKFSFEIEITTCRLVIMFSRIFLYFYAPKRSSYLYSSSQKRMKITLLTTLQQFYQQKVMHINAYMHKKSRNVRLQAGNTILHEYRIQYGRCRGAR